MIYATDTSQFSEKRIAERTPVISLDGSQPLSLLRDRQQTSGSGAVTDEGSEFRVRHSGSGDFARCASQARGIYVPGVPAEVGIGIRTDFEANELSDDEVAEWGYFDMVLSGDSDTETVNNGLLFGVDANGLYVRVVKNGSEVSSPR
jgi:hypothetical protein